MHATDFFNIIVYPTTDEFLRDRLDLRKAMLSVLVLQNMPEYFFASFYQRKYESKKSYEKRLKDFKQDIYIQNETTRFINEIANATKHVRPLSDKDITQFYTYDATNRLGLMRCGVMMSDKEIWTDDERRFLLKDIVEVCRGFWVSRLNAVGGSS